MDGQMGNKGTGLQWIGMDGYMISPIADPGVSYTCR